MLEFSHKPVMPEECMEGLSLREGGIYYDGTIGGGGHSYEILRRTSPSGRLIATDLDDEAIAAATGRLAPFAGRFSIYKSNYKDFERVFDEAGIDKVDGALLDFGVSSHQIDDAERGFSYRQADAPLDMRMDRGAPLTAEKVLNTYPEEALARIIKEYGEEPFAKTIAKNIVRAREKLPVLLFDVRVVYRRLILADGSVCRFRSVVEYRCHIAFSLPPSAFRKARALFPVKPALRACALI